MAILAFQNELPKASCQCNSTQLWNLSCIYLRATLNAFGSEAKWSEAYETGRILAQRDR